ncbi:MAG: lysophospholipid acyltransferase family protein [Flavisolibacter sp.]
MYYLVYGCLYGLSLLPLRVLYGLSDVFFLFIYYVGGYRKKVVRQNLAIAFPEKTEKERRKIEKKFYRNLTDFFVETIKLFSADDRFVDRHYQADYSVFETLEAAGKKCQVHVGHNFNWELGYHSIVSHIRQKTLGVYMPLSSGVFERIFQKLRARKGGYLLPATDMRRAILPFRQDPYALLLVADQSPAGPDKGLWVRFFDRPTCFIAGPEKGAVAGNLSVVFCQVKRIKRGYYQAYFTLAEENPATLEKGALTTRYAHFLEEKMREQPDNWLWSHRRWKWEWKKAYGPVYE